MYKFEEFSIFLIDNISKFNENIFEVYKKIIIYQLKVF